MSERRSISPKAVVIVGVIGLLGIGIWIGLADRGENSRAVTSSSQLASGSEKGYRISLPTYLVRSTQSDETYIDQIGSHTIEWLRIVVIDQDVGPNLKDPSKYLDELIPTFLPELPKLDMSSYSNHEVIGEQPGYTKEFSSVGDSEHPRGYYGTSFITVFPDKKQALVVVAFGESGSDVRGEFHDMVGTLKFVTASGDVIFGYSGVEDNGCAFLQSRETNLTRKILFFPEWKNVVGLLPNKWEFATLCPLRDSKTVWVLRLDRTFDNEVEKQQYVSSTTRLFPKLKGRYLAGTSEPKLSDFFIYVTHISQFKLNAKEVVFQPQKLYPIVGLAWPQELSGCYFVSGEMESGEVRIACGGGDNGCYEHEIVEYNIFSKALVRWGFCSKNCDLATDEPLVSTCER